MRGRCDMTHGSSLSTTSCEHANRSMGDVAKEGEGWPLDAKSASEARRDHCISNVFLSASEVSVCGTLELHMASHPLYQISSNLSIIIRSSMQGKKLAGRNHISENCRLPNLRLICLQILEPIAVTQMMKPDGYNMRWHSPKCQFDKSCQLLEKSLMR